MTFGRKITGKNRPMTSDNDKKTPVRRQTGTLCDRCVHFDYDEDADAMVCTMSMDEDEYSRYIAGKRRECPYFRFYDEYLSVRKQN